MHTIRTASGSFFHSINLNKKKMSKIGEEVNSKKVISPLSNTTVEFKLVERDGGWLSQINPNHDGKTLFSNAKITFIGLPYDNKNGCEVDPLTEDEKEFFESKQAGLNIKDGELSIYHADSYWKSFILAIPKDGLKFKLNNPTNYLKYKFLMAQKNVVAPSWEERFDKGSYKFALVSETHDTEQSNKRAELQEAAYAEYGKMKNNSEKMRSILRLYGKNVSADSGVDFLRGEIQKLIEKDIHGLLRLCEDKDFDLKVFIEKAIEIGEINKVARNNYAFPHGESIGTIDDVIDYLKLKKNTDIRLKIQTRIDASSGK